MRKMFSVFVLMLIFGGALTTGAIVPDKTGLVYDQDGFVIQPRATPRNNIAVPESTKPFQDSTLIDSKDVKEGMRCGEEKYWFPSANACLNMGETCTNHQCNNNTICDINEGCGCGDCASKQDHCAAGLIYDYVASNPNNSSCERIECGEGTYFCPATQTCIPQGTTCSDNKCNNNTICDFNEGCGCRDCDGQQDHCADTLVCNYNSANPNNSSCVSTTCEPGQYWCSATSACIANSLPCGGICTSPLILHNNQCIVNGSCLPGNRCCPVSTYFCSSRSSCIPAGQTCTI